MKELEWSQLNVISGAQSDINNANSQLLNDISSNIAWGAGMGLIGGPMGALAGGAGGALQTVIQGAYKHGSVNVQMPQVPMRPSWGSPAPKLCNPPAITAGCPHY